MFLRVEMWQREDVDTLLTGIFDINRKLALLAEDVRRIRYVVDDDGEEEEDDETPDG